MELQSSEITKIAPAIVKMQSVVQHAVKDAKNPHFKSQYASLESVIDVTREPLASCELSVVQQSMLTPDGPVLVTTLLHSSGQWLRSYLPILNAAKTAQGQGSGITYARRYALAALCGITQTDDDGNEASATQRTQVTERMSQSQARPSQPTSMPQSLSPGDFVCQIGKKYKGKRIADIPEADLMSFVEWLKSQPGDRSRGAHDFIEAAEAFLGAPMPVEEEINF